MKCCVSVKFICELYRYLQYFLTAFYVSLLFVFVRVLIVSSPPPTFSALPVYNWQRVRARIERAFSSSIFSSSNSLIVVPHNYHEHKCLWYHLAMEELPPKRELFCRFYTQNEDLFGNATHSYAEAYDYKLDTLDTEAVWSESEGDSPRERLDDSPYEKAIHGVAVEA